MAILQIPRHLQTWLLYHNALSSDVVVHNILRYARKSQESGGNAPPNDDLLDQISELRKVVQKQEVMIKSLSGSGMGSSTNAITIHSDNLSLEPIDTQHNPMDGFGRNLVVGQSMSAPTLHVSGVAHTNSPSQSSISSLTVSFTRSFYTSSPPTSISSSPKD